MDIRSRRLGPIPALFATVLALVACTPAAGPTPTGARPTPPATATPTNGDPTVVPTAASTPATQTTGAAGRDPAYTAACTTAEPTIDELATALEEFDPNADPTELEDMLDDLASTLLFVEDSNLETAHIAGTALTAITGLSLAIADGEDISAQVGPAAAAVRALQARVCG